MMKWKKDIPVHCCIAFTTIGAYAACAPASGTHPAEANVALQDGGAGAEPTPSPPNPSTTPHVVVPATLAKGLLEPRGITLVRDSLYVAEHGGGRIVAVPVALGGRGDPVSQPLPVPIPAPIVSGLAGPFGIVNSSGSNGSSGDDNVSLIVSESDGGRVLRVSLDGKRIDVIATGASQPRDVRVDVDGSNVCWFDAGGDAGVGSLRCAPITASTTSTNAPSSTRVVVDRITAPRGLSLGAVSSRVFFTADSAGDADASTGSKGVFTANASTALPATTTTTTPPAMLLSATTNAPQGIAADEAAGWVYWAARKGGSVGSGEGWIRRTKIDDSDGGVTESLCEAAHGVDRVVVHEGWVYFTTADTLARVPVSGGKIEDLAVHTAIGDLLVANGTVYFTDIQAGRVHSLALP